MSGLLRNFLDITTSSEADLQRLKEESSNLKPQTTRKAAEHQRLSDKTSSTIYHLESQVRGYITEVGGKDQAIAATRKSMDSLSATNEVKDSEIVRLKEEMAEKANQASTLSYEVRQFNSTNRLISEKLNSSTK